MKRFLCVFVIEVTKAQSLTGGKPPKPEVRYVDLGKEKPIKVSTKVLVPVKEHPKVILNSLNTNDEMKRSFFQCCCDAVFRWRKMLNSISLLVAERRYDGMLYLLNFSYFKNDQSLNIFLYHFCP